MFKILAGEPTARDGAILKMDALIQKRGGGHRHSLELAREIGGNRRTVQTITRSRPKSSLPILPRLPGQNGGILSIPLVPMAILPLFAL